MTTFGDQVFEFGGAPVSGGRYSNPWATHYFVDGDNGSIGNGGLRPDDAMAKPEQAISLASAGDVIYVRSREAQADGSDVTFYNTQNMVIPVAKDFLSIIGVVPGNKARQLYGPFVRMAAAGYTLDVYAAAFHMENMILHLGGSATGTIILRGASGYAAKAGACGATIESCAISYGGMLIEGGGDCLFRNCMIRNATPMTFDASDTPARRHSVVGCEFRADNGDGSDENYIRILGTSTEFFIRDCYFDQIPDTDEYIHTSGVVGGIIANCFFNDPDVTVGPDAADEIRIEGYATEGSMRCVACHDSGSLIIAGT